MAKPTIRPCPIDRRPEALRILHAGLPADLQAALVHALEAEQSRGDDAFGGLLVATEAESIVGAAWTQLSAGRTAVFWPPSSSGPAAAVLMQASDGYLDEHAVVLAQFLVSDESAIDAAQLAIADFRKLAVLDYLTLDRRLFPTEQPAGELSFAPHAAAEPERLGELLLRTYVGSRDCPKLDGVRTADDVLSGYREQGTFAEGNWFFVQRKTRTGLIDIGALILCTHEEAKNGELVYMGLVPEVRGNGWGQQLLDFAMWRAGQLAVERLVLAVDASNQPAVQMYQHAGFIAWDHRTVYARLRPDA